MAAERSFIAIKPDGVQRGLVGLKLLTPSREHRLQCDPRV